jgi:hypothetical protein
MEVTVYRPLMAGREYRRSQRYCEYHYPTSSKFYSRLKGVALGHSYRGSITRHTENRPVSTVTESNNAGQRRMPRQPNRMFDESAMRLNSEISKGYIRLTISGKLAHAGMFDAG